MWLLEVNKCPTMEHSTEVTARLVPMMLKDMVKVVVDWKDEQNNKRQGTGGRGRVVDTGMYDLIFEAPYVKETIDIKNKADLVIEGK